MSTSTRTWGSGDNLFTLTYKDDEEITTSGDHSYMSGNFEANSFAAFQRINLTQFFEAGNGWNYNSADENNCIWQKFDNTNHTDILEGTVITTGYYTLNSLAFYDGSKVRIVTDLSDIQRVIWRPEIEEDTVTTSINGSSETVTIYKINTSTSQSLIDIVDKDNPMNYTVQNLSVWPWLLNPDDKTQLQLHFKRYDQLSAYGNYCERNSGSRVNGINNPRYYPLSTAMINYTVPLGNNQDFGFYSDDNNYLFHCTLSTNNYAQCHLNCYICSEDELKKYLASCGFKFIYKNKLYKPVAVNDVIVGYTDDLMSRSDWDDWHTRGDHDIPVTPPVPSGDDEDEDTAISTAGAPFAKGLVNYYALTAGSVLIDHISEALSTWNLQNTGKDLYKNLVSCKLIKPPAAIPTTGSEPFTIYGEKPQYQGADITLPVVSGNPDASFGPYSISRKFNDFRDYAPYTRVCIYLPYCGWCDLPSHVVGRSVTVKYFTDIIAATVRAVVFCGNNIVAEAAGVMGLDIPFTADAVGMKQAGVVSGLTAYAGGALQTAAGVAQLVASKDAKGLSNVFSGASKVVSAYTQTAIAFNENTTEISGKNGDGCCLSSATNIIIKIIRPKYGASSEPPYVPAGFAHSIGFVSNKQVKVGNVSGLLIADNVDTSGIAGATDAERAEIKRVLETGLIVNAAPE